MPSISSLIRTLSMPRSSPADLLSRRSGGEGDGGDAGAEAAPTAADVSPMDSSPDLSSEPAFGTPAAAPTGFPTTDSFESPAGPPPLNLNPAPTLDAAPLPGATPALGDPTAGIAPAGAPADVAPAPLGPDPMPAPAAAPDPAAAPALDDPAAAAAPAGVPPAGGVTEPIATTFDDGSQLVVNPDGSTYAKGTDGSQSVTLADGTKFAIDADGARSITRPDGTKIDETQLRLAEQFGGRPEDYAPAFHREDHRDWATEAARENGFTNGAEAFGNAASNVDVKAWDNPAAHATTGPDRSTYNNPNGIDNDWGRNGPPPGPQQEAIDQVNGRALNKAVELRNALDSLAQAWDDGSVSIRGGSYDQAMQRVVDAAGDLTHMIQDNWAHGGMTYDQHAGMMLLGQDPDKNPAFRPNAQEATRQFYGMLADEMRNRGLDPSMINMRNSELSSIGLVGQLPGYVVGGVPYKLQTELARDFPSLVSPPADTQWNRQSVNDSIFRSIQTGLNRH